MLLEVTEFMFSQNEEYVERIEMLEYKIQSYTDDIFIAKESYEDLKKDFDKLKRK